MESGSMQSSTSVAKCCDCGCSYCGASTYVSYPGTWLRSVKRKFDEFAEDGDSFFIPGLSLPEVARVEIGNECAALREMVSNQQQSIHDLSVELEEERNASSSAANEAMSMILRLQREKAEVQMEARQFKRFSEEKMAHDQQEFFALEDLLYKREQIIQSLTCEVQAYKHRMMSYGLTESEAEGEKDGISRINSFATNLESQFEFPAYDYPPLKCNSNENQASPELDNETVDIEKYPFGETPRSLKDIEERINQLERSPTHSQPVLEKVIVGHSPRVPKHSRRLSNDSSGSFFATVKEDLVSDSPRVRKMEGPQTEDYSNCKKVDNVSELGDDMSDRVYTIDSIHNGAAFNSDPKANIYDDISTPKESSCPTDIADPEVAKLYARLHALEADRESMRQALISMRTDKAQLVLLKEIAQHLCKEMAPANRVPVKKSTGGSFSFVSAFKWIASFVYWRKRARRNQHLFGSTARNAGLLMVLDKTSQVGQWRCLTSTQV